MTCQGVFFDPLDANKEHVQTKKTASGEFWASQSGNQES